MTPIRLRVGSLGAGLATGRAASDAPTMRVLLDKMCLKTQDTNEEEWKVRRVLSGDRVD